MPYDNNLHLITEKGVTIRPLRERDGQVIFMIPPNVRAVRIASNVSRPCDVVGPFVDDRRQLGILVGEAWHFTRTTTTKLTSHLLDEKLPGWNNVEGGSMRWTAGNALLELGETSIDGVTILAISVHSN